MDKRRKSSFDVGYKRPPRATQFKPGQSGNPQGRPKSKLSLWETLEQELNRRIPVTEGGTRKKITLRVASMKQLVNKAASGDIRALTLLLKELGIKRPEGVLDRPAEIDGPDEVVMASIVRRIRLMDPPPPLAEGNVSPDQ